MRVFYLHTIEGKPAYFSKGDGQIVYAEDSHWRGRVGPQPLRKTLRQIRRDQQTTIQNRRKWFGPRDEGAGKYGYVRVTVPA